MTTLTLKFIKAESERFLIAKDKEMRKLYSTLAGGVENKLHTNKEGKTEEQIIISEVKAIIEGAETLYKSNNDKKLLREIEAMVSLLPKKMSEAEILSILEDNSFTELPKVMQYFKQFGPSVDMAQVRKLFLASQ